MWLLALGLTAAAASSKISVEPVDTLPLHDRCEPITVPFCQGIQYNFTMMPNRVNHNSQREAGIELQPLVVLVKVGCSGNLQLFLCSVYVPFCDKALENPMPPCREFCESVRNDCEDTMTKYSYLWPVNLECSNFPSISEVHKMCFYKDEFKSGRKPPVVYRAGIGRAGGTRAGPPPGAPDHGFPCPAQLTVPKSLEYALRVGENVEPDCGAPCDSSFFSEKQRRFSRGWVGAWGAACAVSCLFTVLTFLIDPERFRYPERPIIFLSLCYLLVAAAYAAGWAAGDSVSCREPFPPPAEIESLQMVSTVTQGTKHEMCTVLFMVLYFFGMASSIWWVVLTLTWFLAAGLKWGHEAIEANSQYFHLAAWAVPAIKTISILAMGKVEGEFVKNAPGYRFFSVSIECLFLSCGQPMNKIFCWVCKGPLYF